MPITLDSTQLRYTRLKLKMWGVWCQQVMTWGLDYSSSSLLYRVVKEGGLIVKSTANTLGPDHEDAQRVDEAVERLGKACPQWAKVLTIHYVKDGSVHEKIGYSKLSKRSYFYYLKQAETWIASAMD